MNGDCASVLIVDDCMVNRLLVVATLSRDGYRILQAESGSAGLEMIVRESPELVILDLMMDGMNGAEMMRRLHSPPGASMPKVLLMTAMDETESALKAREIGADAYLTKPFAPPTLRTRVKELLTPQPR